MRHIEVVARVAKPCLIPEGNQKFPQLPHKIFVTLFVWSIFLRDPVLIDEKVSEFRGFELLPFFLS